jgi:predicted nucleic acid-binding protein
MIFLDTGAFLARYFARDANHGRAVKIWKTLDRAPLLTSNHVLDETITLLGRRAGYTFAAERAERFYSSQAMQILYPGPEEEVEAILWLRKFADQEASFTDCVSFVLMKRHHISTAFTFDRHFSRAGFRTLGA